MRLKLTFTLMFYLLIVAVLILPAGLGFTNTIKDDNYGKIIILGKDNGGTASEPHVDLLIFFSAWFRQTRLLISDFIYGIHQREANWLIAGAIAAFLIAFAISHFLTRSQIRSERMLSNANPVDWSEKIPETGIFKSIARFMNRVLELKQQKLQACENNSQTEKAGVRDTLEQIQINLAQIQGNLDVIAQSGVIDKECHEYALLEETIKAAEKAESLSKVN